MWTRSCPTRRGSSFPTARSADERCVVSRSCESGAMQAPVVLVVDGNSIVHRSYHAQAQTGMVNWAVRGLLTQLVAAVERIRPSLVVVGFDDPDHSVRREQWPSYKAQRTDKLDTLVEQLACAAAALRELGVAVIVPPGMEADDVL